MFLALAFAAALPAAQRPSRRVGGVGPDPLLCRARGSGDRKPAGGGRHDPVQIAHRRGRGCRSSTGRVRIYVEADVGALIAGTAAIPTRVGWLVDVPLDPRGRAPKLKKRRVLAFAVAVADAPADPAGRPGRADRLEPSRRDDGAPHRDRGDRRRRAAGGDGGA
ncbi:hypothetical protein AB5I41_26245 [Sphingomonas sp. MMS24-JH45]